MRLVRPLILAALAVLATPAPDPARAESIAIAIAKNDGFIGDPATFAGGFAAGDIIAARLSLEAGFSAVLDVEVVFGGGGTAGPHPVTVKIWDDTAETLEPGVELFSTDTTLSTSGQLQVISTAGVGVPSRFRVGIILREPVPPMVGQDTDGTIDVDRNLVRRGAAAWQTSQSAGATGDWIIRALLLPGGGGGGGGGGNGACFGDDGCPFGQFCDTAAELCTSECQSEEDCGGAFCNNRGQCVGEDAGCFCQGGAGPGYPAAFAGIGVLALVLRRRRHRRGRR